jgi:aldehyde:ferredoxin oxidoreductase
MGLGITGKILRVQLSEATHSVEHPGEAWYRSY